MKPIFGLPLLWAIFTGGIQAADPSNWRVEAKLEIGFDSLNEVSGISRSPRFPNQFWLHNDSGDSARLFAIDQSGSLLFPQFLKFHGQKVVSGTTPWPGFKIELAANYDWEDIASDEDWIYIADTGNNGNARRDLGIYKVPQFNAGAVEKTRAMSFIPVAYPEQHSFPGENWHFDAEALFVDQGQLYLITKHRVAGRISQFEPGGNLYRVDSSPPAAGGKVVKVDSSSELFMVTAADLSPSREKLAVLGYRNLWIFLRPQKGDRWLSRLDQVLDLAPFEMGQVEAVTFVDEDLLWVLNEAGQVFEVEMPAQFGE
ncbi:MAG: hypothetical protein L7T26_01330 [Pseudomonadales bacterium]|jgi:hypothetical protein|nr:hypothetical protein [Pseudomonadales bacterium]